MRTVITINQDWNLFPCTSEKEEPQRPAAVQEVALPYVWNKEQPSLTGCYAYQKLFKWEASSAKVFLEFGAVAGVCRVWLNGSFVGEHRGGYARFRFELSPYLQEGQNRLTVTADNTNYEDIAPLGGDFNNYGGIYRDVKLILTETSHFELLDYGGSGVELEVAVDGTVRLKAKVQGESDTLWTEYILSDNGREVARTRCMPAAAEGLLKVEKPHLWNGKADPHMYHCTARLMDQETCVDEIHIPFGFRSVEITADRGLLLNGQRVTICGVAKHQDYEGAGCAPSCEQLDRIWRV